MRRLLLLIAFTFVGTAAYAQSEPSMENAYAPPTSTTPLVYRLNPDNSLWVRVYWPRYSPGQIIYQKITLYATPIPPPGSTPMDPQGFSMEMVTEQGGAGSTFIYNSMTSVKFLCSSPYLIAPNYKYFMEVETTLMSGKVLQSFPFSVVPYNTP